MALSVQNKNFLSLLHKLDIDIKQFPDLSFDGLFENVPKDINYFFNWFMENITSDNVLTQSEQAIYFELETSQTLPTEEEMNYFLSSCHPTYEELQALDINYVNNYLPEELEGLKRIQEELSTISSNLELEYNNIKKKNNGLKESANAWGKKLATVVEECNSINDLSCKRLDEVEKVLLTKPDLKIDFDLYNALLSKEEKVFNLLENSKSFQNKMSTCSSVDILPKLEEDLTLVNVSLIFSEASLNQEKAKIEFLSRFLQKELTQKSFDESFNFNILQSNEEMCTKLMEKIEILENDIYNRVKVLSHKETQKILKQYLLQKIELNNNYLNKLTQCRDYLDANKQLSSLLDHIVVMCISSLEENSQLRKKLFAKLSQEETTLSNDITNLELRRQRFKEVSSQKDQHPFLLALKDANLCENPDEIEETFKKIIELTSYVTDDSNFITHKFRSSLQASIKSVFDNELCGPTSQILFAPIELLLKFQKCQEREKELSRVMKRLANKYMEAKESIQKSDRKRLLLWIDLLTNPAALEMKVKDSSKPCEKSFLQK